MPRHKEVKVWVATIVTGRWQDDVVEVAQVDMVETPKQFRLVQNGSKAYRTALRALNYRTTVKKSDDFMMRKLHSSKESALEELLRVTDRELDLARAKMNSRLHRRGLACKALHDSRPTPCDSPWCELCDGPNQKLSGGY